MTEGWVARQRDCSPMSGRGNKANESYAKVVPHIHIKDSHYSEEELVTQIEVG